MTMDIEGVINDDEQMAEQLKNVQILGLNCWILCPKQLFGLKVGNQFNSTPSALGGGGSIRW